MTDTICKEHRSWNMSRIQSKNTKIEVLVRSYLFRQGFRFRKNDKKLPGTPDVVLPRYKTVIFVNGCFWHHHEGCSLAYIPRSRTEFWMDKFHKNSVNDKLNKEKLECAGWRVLTIWECELKADFEGIMNRVARILRQSLQK